MSQQRSKSLMVAAAGSGKTMTALIAASKMLERESLIAVGTSRTDWLSVTNGAMSPADMR